MSTLRVRALPGPSFATARGLGRPQLGGTSGSQAERITALLERALGPNAMLVPKHALVLDADACTLDGQPLESIENWRRVARSEALSRVEGSFVLAWTDEHGALSLARDPIGHRSLYYAYSNGSFAFASSVRALLETNVIPRRLRLQSVAAYLAYAYVPGRHTMVDGIFEVLPGEIVTFHRGSLHKRATWNLPAEPTRFQPEDVLRKNLRDTLERTIANLLPKDRPTAASLSGGIDSSLVVALAQKLAPSPISTFSITFGNEYRDELEWSGMVAEHCGTNHTVVEVTPAAVLAHLDDTIACLDKPNGDPLTVPNALLFREMSTHSDVALNGEGGDPCFGGPKNLPMLIGALYGEDQEDADGEAERRYLRAHLKCFDELPEMLSADALATACDPPLEEELLPWFADSRWNGLVSKLMAINTRYKGGHHILPKVDALSAPFGILARSPLFSKSVVELAFAIPPQLKLRGTDEKYLLKQAVADVLPPAILERPKSGMMVPVEGWFQGPFLPEARRRILDGLGSTNIFRRSYLEKLVHGKLGGLRPRHGVKIWLLVTLEAHLRALQLEIRG